MNRDIEVIHNFLRSGEGSVKANKTWQKIHSEQGVGALTGSVLTLSIKDKEFIRKWVIDTTGIDPLAQSPKKMDRISAAEIAKNEKLATKSVFSGEVKVTAREGVAIPTITGEAFIPPGSKLVVAGSNLVLDGVNVVIVENGVLMGCVNEIILPSELAGSIFLYRGHESDAREVKQILSESEPKSVIGFYDFDPAGLLMGIENGLSEFLLPILDNHLLNKTTLQKINQPNKFWEQSDLFKRLQDKNLVELRNYIDAMKTWEMAIMQEHMAAHKLPLKHLVL